MNITRNIRETISRDLLTKMVFIGGPRQVGKTTLARSFLNKSRQYLTWDDLDDRALIRTHRIDPGLKIVVLDEIHKYARWRTLLKGLFDKYGEDLRILVTGSSRLDHFRKGGDSLVGRYHYHRLHPFTLREITANPSSDLVQKLLDFGGFPEPFTQANADFHRRWQRERIYRVINQDIADLENIKEISLLELLADALPERVGSPLSINSLKEDLEVSPNTVSRWISILESVYYCYRILPYGPPKIRAVKKASKLYLWDWSEVVAPGPRLENMVASHLLKYCHGIEDTLGHRMELRYIRDIDGREIDFVVLKDKKPIFSVECKTGEAQPSAHHSYFLQRTQIPKSYQVHLGTKNYKTEHCHVLPLTEFCRLEQIP